VPFMPVPFSSPSGYTVDYNYASGLDSDISRLGSISDSTGALESYGYLGAGSILTRTNGAGVVHTTTLDDLGRVESVAATVGSTVIDGYGYTYDRNNNRMTKSNATNSAFDEAYTYDDTNQLTGFTRGSDSKDWGFDALGNRTSVATNGGMPDAWTANAQNQITGINGSTTPTYDLNGNMTGDEQGRTLVYDAWNRLVQVKNGSTLLNAYTYDGGNRKVTEDDDTAVTQLVYSAAWQVLEEKVGSSYTNRYVWSPVYVDALVMRDDGTQRVWAIQDANWNVTALVDDSGNVLERIGYDDPYGKVTVYDASWNVKSGGSGYAWEITYQGMRYDETPGLFLQRMRWYSPTLGRWTSNDMLQFAAGDMNLYRMVANNPTNQLDPSGLESWSVDHTQGKITVKMYVNFKFESWERSDGKQEWTKERKEAFIQKFKSEVEAGWNSPKNGNFVLELSKDEMMKKGNYDTLAPNRNAPHRIKLKYNTRYTAVLVIEESSFGSDFVVNVKANPKPAVFCRSTAEVGGDYAYLDEDDVNVSSGGQIPAVHEFGHLLGYGHPGIDPLRPDREDYGKDWDSLMGGGTEMRPDYYSKWATKLSKTTGQNVTVVHYK